MRKGMRLTDEQMQSMLEDLIDYNELRHVLNNLASVCMIKEDHLNKNWQDEGSAAVWNRAATRLCQIVDNLPKNF